jgi:EmrB/QacA subfamily drug resistance transporter
VTSARQTRIQARAHERRWAILAALCFSLLIIVLDNTVLNVAIPTIVRDLQATNSELQWMVDAYTLVFAGLLLTAGALGDRFGRVGALQFGLVVFGVGSLLAAFSTDATQLIATRAFMGIGGAFIMPATLSIITNVFPPEERGKAIGVWAGTAGIASVLGPLLGGFLVEHFFWGSVFLINVPIVIVGIVAGLILIPTSRDPAAPRLDPVGAVLSMVGLVVLLYGIIEAPQHGWTDQQTMGAIFLGLLVLGLFLMWELHSEHPMLDVHIFQNARFSAASFAIMLVFFSLFGFSFMLTQYFQFVLGYSPAMTGVAFLPAAVAMLIVAPLSARFVHRFGTKLVVSVGLLLVSVGMLAISTVGVHSAYLEVFGPMVVLTIGVSLTMAPATESIMGSLPLAKSGIGSAVNDTTRELGGALGVAVVGSLLTSVYAGKISDFLAGKPVPTPVKGQIEQSLGYALEVGKRGFPELIGVAKSAYVDGMQVGLYVTAAVSLVGAIIAFVWLPARARRGSGAEAAGDEEVSERVGARTPGKPDPAPAGH